MALNTVMMAPVKDFKPMRPRMKRKAMQTAGVSRLMTMTARMTMTPMR